MSRDEWEIGLLALRATLHAKALRGTSRWDAMWRAGWACVFLIHMLALPRAVEALFGAEPTAFSAGFVRVFGLALGLLFCAFKIADAPFLRLKPGWRSSVSASIAIALLHVGALGHATRDDAFGSSAPVGVFLFVGTFVDAKLLGRRLWWRRRRRPDRGRKRFTRVHLDPYIRAFEAAFEPAHAVCSARALAPRAPPFLHLHTC